MASDHVEPANDVVATYTTLNDTINPPITPHWEGKNF
jgi:hypothetical protein